MVKMNGGMLYSEDVLSQNVFHKGKYRVSVKRNIEDIKRDLTITIERNYQLDCLTIALSDDEDPCFLCILNITRGDYEELKRQQGLLVDFDNFPAQLLRLLHETSSGNIFLVLQQSNPLQIYLEFIEHNEFKRLVHLSLKTSVASDGDLKKSMAENILNLKKIISNLKTKNGMNETAWCDKYHGLERKVHELTSSLSKLEESFRNKEIEHQQQLKKEKDKYSQEKHDFHKAADSSLKNQITQHQEIISIKERQIEELSTRCHNYQETVRILELQASDKNQRIIQLEKQSQLFSTDSDIFKAKCSSLERDLHDKDKALQIFRQKHQDIEKSLKEKMDKLDELYDMVQSLKREKIVLEEKLSQSESLSAKHNLAVQSSSEQLLKANQIIAKVNSDMVALKEKLMCRTAIALEQEKVIEKNATQMAEQHEKICALETEKDKLKEEADRLKSEVSTYESVVKEKDEIIKNNSLVIQWLQKKVDGRLDSMGDVLEPHISKTSRNFDSTPFLTTIRQFGSLRSRSSKENNPEPMINFYDTEDYSSERHQNGHHSPDFSAKSDACTDASKFNIDPKYLKPLNRKESPENKSAPTDRSLKSSLSGKSSMKTAQSLRGKDETSHVKFSQKATASASSRSAGRPQEFTKSKNKFQTSAYFPPK